MKLFQVTIIAFLALLFVCNAEIQFPQGQGNLMTSRRTSVYNYINNLRASYCLPPLARNTNLEEQARVASVNYANKKTPALFGGFSRWKKTTSLDRSPNGFNPINSMFKPTKLDACGDACSLSSINKCTNLRNVLLHSNTQIGCACVKAFDTTKNKFVYPYVCKITKSASRSAGSNLLGSARCNCGGTSQDVISAWLKDHNDMRNCQLGNGNALAWNESLAQNSLKWAKEIAKTCRLSHSPSSSRPGIGENLYIMPFGNEDDKQIGNIRAGINAFNRERPFYQCGSNTCSVNGNNVQQVSIPSGDPNIKLQLPVNSCGHYTQIVWEGTKTVGCSVVKCATDARYSAGVCQYYPAGNIRSSSGPLRPFPSGKCSNNCGSVTRSSDSQITFTATAKSNDGFFSDSTRVGLFSALIATIVISAIVVVILVVVVMNKSNNNDLADPLLSK